MHAILPTASQNGSIDDLRSIRLVGADLSGRDLQGADLSGLDLSGAKLEGANLSHVSLRGAILNGCKLRGAEFLGADLREADLSECDAPQAGFGHADLRGAVFFHANLEQASLTGAKAENADFRTANLQHARFIETDLRGANLVKADLRHADLKGSRTAGAVLRGADLRNARLRELAGFEKADWVGADIRDVDFCGGYRIRRYIMDQNFLHEFRRQSRRHEFLYKVWWLSSDCGRSISRWAAWNLALGLAFGLAYSSAELVDFGRYPTALSPYYFSFVTLTTLGYGDAMPSTELGQVLAVGEVLFGYFGLGGLLAIVGNKMARRAD